MEAGEGKTWRWKAPKFRGGLGFGGFGRFGGSGFGGLGFGAVWGFRFGAFWGFGAVSGFFGGLGV